MKKTLVLGTLITLSTLPLQAVTTVIPYNGATPFVNQHQNGYVTGYWWGGGGPGDTTIQIGNANTVGTAFVDISYGAHPTHAESATWTINSGSGLSIPVTAFQKLDIGGNAVADAQWSGYGGGQTMTGFNASANINVTETNAVSAVRVSMINGTLISASDQMGDSRNSAFTGQQAGYTTTPTGDGYRYGAASAFYYIPGLTGTFDLEVSWGVNQGHSNDMDWVLDVDGDTVFETTLLSGLSGRAFSDGLTVGGISGTDAAALELWSGFADAGQVTLNANSVIAVRANDSSNPTPSDLQLTAIPEPSVSGFAVGIMALLALGLRRRKA